MCSSRVGLSLSYPKRKRHSEKQVHESTAWAVRRNKHNKSTALERPIKKFGCEGGRAQVKQRTMIRNLYNQIPFPPSKQKRRYLYTYVYSCFPVLWEWSAGAIVLGKLPVPGRPTIWMIVGQGPIALAVGAVGYFWTFLISPLSFLSSFSLSLEDGPIYTEILSEILSQRAA